MSKQKAATDISLARADQLRKQGRWSEAARIYSEWLTHNPAAAAVVLNLALCFLVLGRFEEASRQSLRIPAGDPNAWRAQIIHARAQLGLGEIESALSSLRRVQDHNPADADIALELADILLQQVGDAGGARRAVTPFVDGGGYREAALQTYIVASLYDREEGDGGLVEKIRAFASRHLYHAANSEWNPTLARCGARKRVGLVSGYFCVSPVYFLTYAILEHLATQFDLIFYDRGSKKDWANKKFRGIACEWVDVDQANPIKLNQTLRAGHLDALLEMAGWSDVDVLKAIADKPCPKIFKWVGGQSATTGMGVFDGFISDRVQTPPETQSLYDEPLVNLECGYTAYTPPDYLPEVVQPRRDVLLLGVIGNPVKVTAGFLADIANTIGEAASKIPVPIVIQFIDSRYSQKIVRSRIAEILRPYFDKSTQVAVLFTHPRSHKDFLAHVGKLSAVVDTWPYSAGLTAIEALAMGVPVLGGAGTLCSGRHAASHHHFATRGRPMRAFSPAGLVAIRNASTRTRKALDFRRSARSQPEKVAASLGRLLDLDMLCGRSL